MAAETAGLLTLLALAAVVALYVVLSGSSPDRRVEAVVTHTAGLDEGSPVRVAGVDVGRVGDVRQAPGDETVVVLELDEDAPRVRRDATLKIRPRLVLEGGFFADLRPGSPAAAELRDGDRLPRSQTAVAVQLDEVLSALTKDPRAALGDLLRGWGGALTADPTAADDRDAAPRARGQAAADSLNDALADAPAALRSSAVAAQALRGRRPGDATRLVAGLERVAAGLGQDRFALASMVQGLEGTAAALAAERMALRAAVRELPGTLAQTDRALTRVRAVLPDVRALARETLPGLRAVPAASPDLRALSRQVRRLSAPAELGRLAADLRPVAGGLASLARTATGLLGAAGRISRCATGVLLPTGRKRLDDGALSTGVENYKELFYALVGFTGEGQNFDGNGTYVRFQPGGGPHTVAVRPGAAGGEAQFAHTSLPPLGTRPAYPGRMPRVDASRRCATQPVPDLSAPAGPADGGGRR
ncbi:MAG TPA: MlaD family protein [Baekduia sp.]|nr:MlaD family protein [Baekduia sp.]